MAGLKISELALYEFVAAELRRQSKGVLIRCNKWRISACCLLTHIGQKQCRA